MKPPEPPPDAAVTRARHLLAVLRDGGATDGEKSSAAARLGELYKKHPELASVALDEPAVPAWLDPSRLASVGHKSVRTVHRAGLIDDAAATLMDEILDDWLSPDDDKSGQR